MNFIENLLTLNSTDFYSNLDLKAQQLLSFEAPPRSVQIAKQITPELYSHYSLGHGETFFGYCFRNQDRLLYGRLYGDFRLDGIYSSIYKDLTFLVSGTSAWDSNSYLQMQLISDKPLASSELVLNTDNVLGISNLFKITRNWQLGSEMFYTFSESSGGMSIGARFQSDTADMNATLISNPIMGHIKSNLYRRISDTLKLATQYELNVYSMDSDISVGGEYKINDDGQILKLKASLRDGAGVGIKSMFDWGMVSLGFSVGKTTAAQWGISLEVF